MVRFADGEAAISLREEIMRRQVMVVLGCLLSVIQLPGEAKPSTLGLTGESEPISQEQAIAIATQDAGGFLGTWVRAFRCKNQWLIKAFSKSARPPAFYVVDGISRKILYKNLNSDGEVRISGKAMDVQGGAMLVTDNHMDSYVEYLGSWPRHYLGKRVTVTGRLGCKEKTNAGAEGEQLVLEHAQWKTATGSKPIEKPNAADSTPTPKEVSMSGRDFQMRYDQVTLEMTETDLQELLGMPDKIVEDKWYYGVNRIPRLGEYIPVYVITIQKSLVVNKEQFPGADITGPAPRKK
jgi:hypothetical protein